MINIFFAQYSNRMKHPLRRSVPLFTAARSLLLLFIMAFFILPVTGKAQQRVIAGAERMDAYLPLLQGKRVAVLINHTSRVYNSLLVDTLQKRGVKLVKILVPEHGLRGTASAGAHINNSYDSATGLQIISLHGDNKKPKAADLADLDVVVYDLQDVGVRFYTYISTLQYVMEACAENGKRLIVLDRPDPNGMYVDGPVLDTSLKSFVGMQPVPIVYGMTPGEYAMMLKGENRFNKARELNLKVITCDHWDHNTRYHLPVAPSPNLRTDNAINLYPSICLFEGTVFSLGRGTNKPFEQWGHPALEGKAADSFRPESIIGARNPPLEGKTCYGVDLSNNKLPHGFRLQWLIQAYKLYPEKDKFFISFFEKLAGTTTLRKQIQQGLSEEAIRKTWEPGLSNFKKIRKKYLLYTDF
jgi:uncharacterized protein YbbC (DUF1343 family)